MRNTFLCSLVLLFAGVSAFSQATSTAQKFDGSVELISHAFLWPRPAKGQPLYLTQEMNDKPKFDLVTLKQGCSSTLCIHYGSRFGDNWDIFNIGGGATSQTRMVRIGKYNWTDNFKVPNVEPWAALAPGDRRTVSINTSGGDGADGSNGASGRGGGAQDIRGPDLSAAGSMKNEGYAHATLGRQVGSTVKTADGKTHKDNYSPVVEAKLGYMYVVRVKDATHDYYVLVHVDELKRGERLVLSYKKMEIPKSVY